VILLDSGIVLLTTHIWRPVSLIMHISPHLSLRSGLSVVFRTVSAHVNNVPVGVDLVVDIGREFILKEKWNN
jgi:hypothetical protein